VNEGQVAGKAIFVMEHWSQTNPWRWHRKRGRYECGHVYCV